MSESHDDRKKKLLEMLEDPRAIEEIMECFDCDRATAQEMWELFQLDLLPEMNPEAN